MGVTYNIVCEDCNRFDDLDKAKFYWPEDGDKEFSDGQFHTLEIMSKFARLHTGHKVKIIDEFKFEMWIENLFGAVPNDRRWNIILDYTMDFPMPKLATERQIVALASLIKDARILNKTIQSMLWERYKVNKIEHLTPQEIGPFSEFLLALIIQSEPERLKEENRTFFVKTKEK